MTGEEAIATGRKAVELACAAKDEGAEAHARLRLGTALLMRFREGEAEEDYLDALDSLDRAASVYQTRGSIDFATALLTMAEAFRDIGELDSADGVYARVIDELTDPRWAESAELARHANHVRGRGFVGLGYIELERDRPELSLERFEAALPLLLAGDPRSGAPIIEAIAETLASELGEPELAARVRAAATDRWAAA